MTAIVQQPSFRVLRHELSEMRGGWGLFVAIGVALVVMGIIALGALYVATLATALAIGILLLASGVAEIIGAFFARAWSGFFYDLLSGVLSAVVGVLFLRAPVGALLALTLLLACLLMVEGIFKIVAAASYRFAIWGWPLVSGIIDLTLGIMIWFSWPASSFWVIGMFLGINLIFRGFNWVALGMALRTMTRPAAA